MRFFRYYPIFLVPVALLLLTAALPLPSQPASRSSPPPVEDPGAAQVLDNAVARLNGAFVPIIEAQYWQRMHLKEFNCEAKGRFLQGPDHRYRFELHTLVGKNSGTLLMVSDGQTRWQALRFGSGAWTEVRQSPVGARAPRANPGRGQMSKLPALPFSGVQPLLANLRSRLVWTGREQAFLEGMPCVRLTGTWKSSSLDVLAPASAPWPDDLATECQLWLDAVTLWPRRIEWHGPPAGGGKARLLVEMELRAPVFSLALSPERCATEFTFDATADLALSEIAKPQAAQ